MNKIELGAKIAAIITAMVAVVVFAINVFDDQRIHNQEKIDIWRKAEIQKIFHTDDNGVVEFSDLLSEMKSRAMDDEELDIMRDDLSEGKVRTLLSELIASGILYQAERDTYALSFSGKHEAIADGDHSGYSELLKKVVETEVARTISQKLLEQRDLQYLGEVSCGETEEFNVPDSTSYNDWKVLGIVWNINSEFVDDKPHNNALLGYKTRVDKMPDGRAWKVSFVTRTNFGVAQGNNRGDCNKSGKEKKALKGELSTMHFVAFRKHPK